MLNSLFFGLVVLDVKVGSVIIKPTQPTHESFVAQLPQCDVLKHLVPKVVDFLFLAFELQHHGVRGRREIVVFVVGNFLAQKAVAWRESYLQDVVLVRVLEELLVHHSVENLDHTADHLSDLVV